jgi:hypothetical protein
MGVIMDKKYQVFISSTYTDLIKERKEVTKALLEMDCIPSGMEMFQASDDSQWELIKRVISSCDYYIVIIAGRYGTIHPETKKSYTQMEYEYAAKIGIPIIGFLYETPENLPANKQTIFLSKDTFFCSITFRPISLAIIPGRLTSNILEDVSEIF